MRFPVEETIRALADNQLRRTEAARQLWISQNAMRYRIDAIKRETGLDPTNFWDMQKLVELYGIEGGRK